MVSIEFLKEIEHLTQCLYSGVKDSTNLEILQKHYNLFESSYNGFIELFSILFASNHQLSLFWTIDSLCKIADSTYRMMDSSSRLLFRGYLQKVFIECWQKYAKYTAIGNKLALLIVIWLKLDYPEGWKTMPGDFKALIFESLTVDEKSAKLDLFINVLNIFDDELIKFRHTFDQFLESKSTIIKDTLRVDPQLTDIINLLSSVIINRDSFPTKTVVNSLKSIGNFIDWNNLNLFLPLIPQLQELLTNSTFIKPALEVFMAFANKGMVLKEKIQLLSFIEINAIIDYFLSNLKLVYNSDSLYVLSDMIQSLGIYFIEGIELIRVTECT